MFLSIEPDGPVPIYQQIRDRIVEAIAGGRQPAGLPSTRQLAVDLGVNFHTVNKSYDVLRREGLLRLNRKSGAVVQRDAGSGPPSPDWAEDWNGPARHAARRGGRPGDARRGHHHALPGRHRRLRLPRRRRGRIGPRHRDRRPVMSAGAVVAEFAVPFYGALLCVAPAVTKPTVQFGVRIPPERTGATVIGDQRRAYFLRTAMIGVAVPSWR